MECLDKTLIQNVCLGVNTTSNQSLSLSKTEIRGIRLEHKFLTPLEEIQYNSTAVPNVPELPRSYGDGTYVKEPVIGNSPSDWFDGPYQ